MAWRPHRLERQRGFRWWEQHFAAPNQVNPPMVKSHKSNTDVKIEQPATKNGQVMELLQRNDGASLEEMSTLAIWLPHSTRAFLTGLKKRGHEITSDNVDVDGVRRYRIAPPVGQ